MGIPMALHNALSMFKLPGEGQKIARLMNSFALAQASHCPDQLTDVESTEVLAFAIMMLQTDLHSRTIKKKMTKQEFISNVARACSNVQFPPDFLSQIFDFVEKN